MAINILLIEDDDQKAEQVSQAVQAGKSSAVTLSRARTANEAMQEMRARRYDLVVMDLTLPVRPGEVATPNGGHMLLRSIRDPELVLLPTFVVGLTGYTENLDNFEKDFADAMWILLRYDAAVSAWRKQLQTLVAHVIQVKAEKLSGRGEDDVDVCIVCALPKVELPQVLSLPWAWEDLYRPIGREHFYKKASVQRKGIQLNVAAAACRRMGMVAASQLTTLMIERLRPKLVVMLGICAGTKNRTAIGDVVVADRSWDWQSGKMELKDDKAKFLIDPDFVSASSVLLSALERIQSSELYGAWSSWPGVKPQSPPKIHIGPMASGSVVLSDGRTFSEIELQQRKLTGVDMETYGVYFAAAHSAIENVEFVSIKAVTDFGDPEKADDCQAFASSISATLFDILLTSSADTIFQRSSHTR